MTLRYRSEQEGHGALKSVLIDKVTLPTAQPASLLS